MDAIDRRICIAPMIRYTDKHYRYLMRLITKHTVLYTEMITEAAILHGDCERLLGYNDVEHPIACQIAGSHPQNLAKAAKVIEDKGYDEINLNVGCPSDRVQAGKFGVCLMAEPELVADCLAAMRDAVKIPVTIKTRIGIDHDEGYEPLHRFVDIVVRSGVQTFIIHARKAWLKGLSPKENRTIPPLHYEHVIRLKQSFPELEVIINGGIKDHVLIKTLLGSVDGVMIGREAYANPYLFADVDTAYFGETRMALSRFEVAREYMTYAEKELQKGTSLSLLVKPMLGLFQHAPRGKRWRRFLSEHTPKKRFGADVFEQALDYMEQT